MGKERGLASPVSASPPFSLLQLREASRQSELIAAHSGKSSLALPHMVTRCAARRDSRARHPEERGRELRLKAFISRVCFQVRSVRDKGD